VRTRTVEMNDISFGFYDGLMSTAHLSLCETPEGLGIYGYHELNRRRLSVSVKKAYLVLNSAAAGMSQSPGCLDVVVVPVWKYFLR
jgi:hypothetical protein